MRKLLTVLALISSLFASAQIEGLLTAINVPGADSIYYKMAVGFTAASDDRKVLIYHWPGDGSTSYSSVIAQGPFNTAFVSGDMKKVIAPGDTVYYAVVATRRDWANCAHAVAHADYIFANWLQDDSTVMKAKYRVIFSGYSGGGGEMSKPLTGFCFGGENWYRVESRFQKIYTQATGSWQNEFDLSTIMGKTCYWGMVDVDDALEPNSDNIYGEFLSHAQATSFSVKLTKPVLSGDGHGIIDETFYAEGTDAGDDVWWFGYDTLYGLGPEVTRCGEDLQIIPISEYMFYDLSGAGGFNSNFGHNAGGGTRIDQMVRVSTDPRNTPVFTGFDETLPRQNISINRKYFQDGGLVKWIDFRRKWYIDEIYWLDSSYFNNYFQVWLLDSVDFYQQIANPNTADAIINERNTNHAGSGAWESLLGLEDSARFVMMRFVRGNNDIDGDSFPDIRQIVFYGCPVESMTFADSVFRPDIKKAKLSIREMNGSNFSFGGHDTLIRYQNKQRKYFARATPTYNINYPSTDSLGVHPTEKWNLLSGAADSFQFVTRGNYPYWVLAAPTAGAMKKLKVSECNPCDTWTPVDDVGLNYKDTASYTSAREFSRQIALTYGTGGLQSASTLTPLTEDQRYINRNNLWGIQDGNEDNKWWFGRYESPMVYVAKAWAINLGIRTANSTFHQIMSGVAWDPEWMRSALYLEMLYNGSIFHTDISMHYYDNNYKYDNYPIDPSDASMVGLESFTRYPEHYALPQYDTLEMFIRREARYDTTFETDIGEFNSDKLTESHGRFAVGASDDASGNSMYGIERYKNAAGTTYDSTIGHGIRGIRERLAIMWSRIGWSAQFSFDDYDTEANKPSGGLPRYFGSYTNSGMWNGYDNRKFPLWWMETNLVNRFGDYIPDSVYSYVDGGVCALRAHHRTITDSTLVIVFEGDTMTHNQAYDIPAMGAQSAQEIILSMTTWGVSSSSATITANEIPVETDVIPRFYLFLANPPSSTIRYRNRAVIRN